jgi:hypothetical protein
MKQLKKELDEVMPEGKVHMIWTEGRTREEALVDYKHEIGPHDAIHYIGWFRSDSMTIK